MCWSVMPLRQNIGGTSFTVPKIVSTFKTCACNKPVSAWHRLNSFRANSVQPYKSFITHKARFSTVVQHEEKYFSSPLQDVTIPVIPLAPFIMDRIKQHGDLIAMVFYFLFLFYYIHIGMKIAKMVRSGNERLCTSLAYNYTSISGPCMYKKDAYSICSTYKYLKCK